MARGQQVLLVPSLDTGSLWCVQSIVGPACSKHSNVGVPLTLHWGGGGKVGEEEEEKGKGEGEEGEEEEKKGGRKGKGRK